MEYGAEDALCSFLFAASVCTKMSESDCVAALMKMYEELVGKQQRTGA